MVKKILAAIAAVIVLFIVIVALQPSQFHVERSATIAAPPAAVFAQINDFHKWEAWSPWVKIDPAAKMSYEGQEAGVGAIFRWDGNSEVGQGSMTILESKPNELIRIQLAFVKPFEDTASTSFMLKPNGEGTKVTWSMDGKNNFVGRAICMFMNMDKMIGGKYEEGLANMKAIVEAEKK